MNIILKKEPNWMMSERASVIHRKTIAADVWYFSSLLTHLNICRTTNCKFCFRKNASESCSLFSVRNHPPEEKHSVVDNC